MPQTLALFDALRSTKSLKARLQSDKPMPDSFVRSIKRAISDLEGFIKEKGKITFTPTQSFLGNQSLSDKFYSLERLRDKVEHLKADINKYNSLANEFSKAKATSATNQVKALLVRRNKLEVKYAQLLMRAYQKAYAEMRKTMPSNYKDKYRTDKLKVPAMKTHASLETLAAETQWYTALISNKDANTSEIKDAIKRLRGAKTSGHLWPSRDPAVVRLRKQTEALEKSPNASGKSVEELTKSVSAYKRQHDDVQKALTDLYIRHSVIRGLMPLTSLQRQLQTAVINMLKNQIDRERELVKNLSVLIKRHEQLIASKRNTAQASLEGKAAVLAKLVSWRAPKHKVNAISLDLHAEDSEFIRTVVDSIRRREGNQNIAGLLQDIETRHVKAKHNIGARNTVIERVRADIEKLKRNPKAIDLVAADSVEAQRKLADYEDRVEKATTEVNITSNRCTEAYKDLSRLKGAAPFTKQQAELKDKAIAYYKSFTRALALDAYLAMERLNYVTAMQDGLRKRIRTPKKGI